MSDQLEIEVFRAGDYGPKGQWDEQQLQTIAEDYDPALHEAPVTLDHAQAGPALGWVAAVRRVGDRLVAHLKGLNGQLIEMLRRGSVKKRSVEIYPALRETGRPYLRAVSFLGAGVPEVKGLTDPPAAGEPEAALFAEEEPRWLALDSQEQAAAAEEGREEMPNSRTAIALPSLEEVAARLKKQGKWLPVWEERGIGQFYQTLAAFDEIEVGEGQWLHPAQWFAQFLEELPTVVAFGETASARAAQPRQRIAQGPSVDPSSVALHRSAVAFQKMHPGLGYGEALARCAKS